MFSRAALLLAATFTALALTACPAKPDAPHVVSQATLDAEKAAAAVPDAHVLADDRTCAVDADCTLTTADCCGCNALGSQVGVRKDHVAALAARRAPVCGGVACPTTMSDDATCSANGAVCRDKVCVPESAAASGHRTPTEPIH
jgi:hypothetical protein